MRSHDKNIERFPDSEEVRQIIDEHEDLRLTGITSRAIQQILEV